MTSKQERRATLGETTKQKKEHDSRHWVMLVLLFSSSCIFDEIHRFFLDFEALAVSVLDCTTTRSQQVDHHITCRAVLGRPAPRSERWKKDLLRN